jgi:hypothetical protein
MYIFMDKKWEDKNSGPHDSRNSLSLICNFDVLLSYTNIWGLPQFQKIFYVSLYCFFFLQSVHETWRYTFISSAFSSTAITLIVINKVYAFLFIACNFSSSSLKSSTYTRNWCVRLNANPSWFPWTFYWHILKQSWKAMSIKPLLVSDHSG